MRNFLVLFILSLSIVVFAKSTIEVKSEVEVGIASNFAFEDILNLKRLDEFAIRAVLDLDLPFSQTTQIESDRLTEWIRDAQKHRPDLKNYSFKVPSQIRVARKAGLSVTQVKSRLENRLRLKCKDCTFQIQLTNLPLISSGQVAFDWREVPASGAFMLPVVGSNGEKMSWISGQIKTQRPVIKSSRVLRYGDSLQESDLVIELTDITMNRDYFTDKTLVIGKKLARTISLGSLISSQDIQREYDVRQGQVVRATTGTEEFEISVQVTAQESGVIGDVIRLRNHQNQKMLSGRILEKGMVRIE